jgi:hypothetical protein
MRTLATTRDITVDGSVEFFDDDLVDAVGALKSQEGTDVVVTGSISPGQALLPVGPGRRGPAVHLPGGAGPGASALPERFALDRLRLLDARAFRSGITLARYALD